MQSVLLAFYEAVEPSFATETKVASVCAAFKAKADRAGRPAAWREIMYAKMAGKYGMDPREHAEAPHLFV